MKQTCFGRATSLLLVCLNNFQRIVLKLFDWWRSEKTVKYVIHVYRLCHKVRGNRLRSLSDTCTRRYVILSKSIWCKLIIITLQSLITTVWIELVHFFFGMKYNKEIKLNEHFFFLFSFQPIRAYDHDYYSTAYQYGFLKQSSSFLS